MNKNAKIALIGSGVAAAAMGAASLTLTNSLVKVALDREMPKATERSRQRLTGTEGLGEMLETLSEAGEVLKSSGTETVEIISSDGEKLAGHWQPREDAKRVIIAMHGWRSSWASDFGLIAPFWRENGCSVLYPEQRGQGNSGGDHIGFGLTERYDCLEWIRWVNRRTGAKLPIYLAGISMGATTVLMAAGLELPENVRGIIADCGYTSPHDIWKHVMNRNLHLPYGTLTRSVVGRACRRRIHMGPKDYSCTDALKNSRVPVLFVHGADDHFVPVEMTYENYKACVSPKRLLIVPGAEHGMSYLVNRQGYEEALQAFWQEND